MAGPSAIPMSIIPHPEWHPIEGDGQNRLTERQRKSLDEARRTAIELGLDITWDTLRIAANVLIDVGEQSLTNPMDYYSTADGPFALGHFGSLVRVEYELAPKGQKMFVCIKCFDHPEDRRLLPRIAARELAIHYGLFRQAPNIVEPLAIHGGDLRGVGTKLVMEYIPTTLEKLIDACFNRNIAFERLEYQSYFGQILRGLEFIHGHKVMHRDLNPSNILIDSYGNIKICDFGEARSYASGKPITPGVGTLWYRAPEICLGAEIYGYAVDMWSAGCILAEMFLLEPILQGDNDLQMIDLIGDLLGKPGEWDIHYLEKYTPDMVDWRKTDNYRLCCPRGPTLPLKFVGKQVILSMLQGLLTWNPAARWTASESLSGYAGSPVCKDGRLENSEAAVRFFTGSDELKKERKPFIEEEPTPARVKLQELVIEDCEKHFPEKSKEVKAARADMTKLMKPVPMKKKWPTKQALS